MTTTKQERSAAKAKARSIRNSPGGKLTKAQKRAERKHKTGNRKMRQSARRTVESVQQTAAAMSGLGGTAKDASYAVGKLRDSMTTPKNETAPLKQFAAANAERLSKMTVPELRELATNMGFKVTTKTRKQDIIDMLTGPTE